MRTSSCIKLVVCGVAAAGVVGAYSAPSLAQSTGGSEQSGCGTILEGQAGLQRGVKYETGTGIGTTSFWHEKGDVLAEPESGNQLGHNHLVDFTYPTTVAQGINEATANVAVTLDNAAGSDCSSLRYRLRVVDEDGALLTEMIVPGTRSSTVTWEPTFPFTYREGRFVSITVTAENAKGRVLDSSPDLTPVARVNLTDAGATTSFK